MMRNHGTVLEQRFQERLRALRIRRGMTQQELARAVGIGGGLGAYVAQIESGLRSVGPVTVEKIAGFFGIDPGDLYASRFADTPEASPPEGPGGDRCPPGKGAATEGDG